MSNHTPGPWHVERHGTMPGNTSIEVHSDYASTIAVCSYWGIDDARLANSRLIAAAPDMLSALIEVRARMQGFNLTDAENAMKRVDDAIKKATQPWL